MSNSGRFKPGKSGNPKGRPPGSTNEDIARLRGLVYSLLMEGWETILDDFRALETGKERLQIIDRLLRHVLPAPQDELQRLSDEDLDRLISRLKNQFYEEERESYTGLAERA